MKKLIFIFILFTNYASFANNGDFLDETHPWSLPTQSVAPIYIGVEEFEKHSREVAPNTPQANCTGTLIEDGKFLLTAAHCFRDLCPTRKEKLNTQLSDYFILVDNEKIFFEAVNVEPSYCHLAFELPYEQKLAPNPLLPEFHHDIAIAKIDTNFIQNLQRKINYFPKLRLVPGFDENYEVFRSVGFGVSDRYIQFSTQWIDVDDDNVHDYWDQCLSTHGVKLASGRLGSNLDDYLKTNGCAEGETPDLPISVLTYFESTKISHKRGFEFAPFLDVDWIFTTNRLDSTYFIVNHGYRGSLYPYEHRGALSFGGDSGGPLYNQSFSEIVAITIMLSNSRDYMLNRIIKEKPNETERKALLNSGFTSYLKLSKHKDFIESILFNNN
ncbi:MAG: trypsin-like serine protease [Bdellovibrionales bacterium]|nr:trypsin-like serine protease [Bdellovibrionales bacterium]